MNANRRLWVSIGCFAVLLIGALALAQRGAYGWTLFIALPVIAGGLGTWSLRPSTLGNAAKIGATIGTVGCGLFILFGVEGIICVLMALPVALLVTMAGSLLAYWGGHREKASGLSEWRCSFR